MVWIPTPSLRFRTIRGSYQSNSSHHHPITEHPPNNVVLVTTKSGFCCVDNLLLGILQSLGARNFSFTLLNVYKPQLYANFSTIASFLVSDVTILKIILMTTLSPASLLGGQLERRCRFCSKIWYQPSPPFNLTVFLSATSCVV